MNAIEKTISKLKKLENSMDDIIKRTIERNNDNFNELQADQMQLGKDAHSGFIGNLRSSTYAARKKAKGGRAPAGKVDLRDTGAFQKGIFHRTTQKEIIFESTDSKEPELVEKYGPDIFGLNQESIDKARELFLVRDLRFEVKRFLQAI